EFTGFVDNERLKTVLASSRILVPPSLYEGFGRPPLEALTTGTNAVISDIEVFHEIYDDFPVIFFKAGDSADLAEKVIHAWDFPPPVAIPQKYSFEKTANSMLEILKQ
ncbi:MAG: glycosyltransferase, partial [Treponemataceae bacterium]|nr:glycosyltransferase [Treponemataceae bacterium]